MTTTLNQYNQVHFELLHKLTSLNLRQNNLITLKDGVFRGLPANMEKIDVTNNKLQSIESGLFQDFQLIDEVQLRDNKLASIQRGTFANIKELSLASNSLTDDSISPAAFSNVTKVLLKYNKLTTIIKDWFVTSPNEIEVPYNRLQCDCKLYGNLKALAELDSFYGECYSPKSLKRKSFESMLRDNTLKCTSCALNSCQNKACCKAVDKESYQCHCKSGYSGVYCEIGGGQQKENGSQMSPGLIVLIVLVLIALIIALGVVLYCRSKRAQKANTENNPILSKENPKV